MQRGYQLGYQLLRREVKYEVDDETTQNKQQTALRVGVAIKSYGVNENTGSSSLG